MGARDERQWMRDIEGMHIGQGWGMIGYSYGVGQSGTIYEGCGLTTRPIHSPPRNSDAWGVVHLQPSTGSGTDAACSPAGVGQSAVMGSLSPVAASGNRPSGVHGTHRATRELPRGGPLIVSCPEANISPT